MTSINTGYFYPLKRLNFSFHAWVARDPKLELLYTPYRWWGKIKKIKRGIPPQENVVGSHTQLVIDGFQGSANSFATLAFKCSQQQSVALAHHLHSPAQMLKAIHLQIPVLLTIREPRDTVLSLTTRWPYVSVNQALKSYIGFYSKLEPYRAHCLISDFQFTIGHLDSVLLALNHKFETQFDTIDLIYATSTAKKNVVDTGKRAEQRKALKEKHKKAFDLVKNRMLLDKAQSLYEDYSRLSAQTIQSYVTQDTSY